MSFFVDLATTQEQALDLVCFYNKTQETEGEGAGESAFLSRHKKWIENQDLKQVLNDLVDLQPLVLSKAPEKDVESCLNLLCSVMRSLPKEDLTNLVLRLVGHITSDVGDKPLLRLKLLNNLYNLFEASSPARYGVFLALLKYAEASHTTEVVIPLFPKLASWVQGWNAGVDQVRELYLVTRRILKQANKSLQAHEFLIKYLATFEQGDNSTVDYAVEAAVEAIQIPDIVQLDHLLHIRAIQQLEQSKPQLFALLKLFATDTLEAFNSFHHANPGFLASVGLDHGECLKKIRLLTLATLANHQDTITFAQVSQGLSIEESEVESWVILAISTNVLDAKMDQLRRVVVINRATQRALQPEQWKQMGERLRSWRQHLASLIDVMQRNKA